MPIWMTPRQALKRLYTALSLLPQVPDAPLDWSQPHSQRFKAAMDEDFGTPEAIAVLFRSGCRTQLNQSASHAAELKALGGVLGLLQQSPSDFLKAGKGIAEEEIAN